VTFAFFAVEKYYGAMHFGIDHGADRGKIVSVLRLEGIIERITVIVDDTVICEKGKILA
jgi:aminopeptidase